MIVYRVENEDREGPYYRNNQRWMKNNHQNSKLRPGIDSDGFHKKYQQAIDICGFHSITKLKNWFRERELKILNEKGYCVNKYDIDERFVLTGDSKRQVMFNKNKAKLISKNLKIY